MMHPKPNHQLHRQISLDNWPLAQFLYADSSYNLAVPVVNNGRTQAINDLSSATRLQRNGSRPESGT